MSALGQVLRLVRFTNRAFWRNPANAFFTFAFPLMFLVIFTSLFGTGTVPVAGTEVNVSTFYVAAIATFSIITATYTNLAINVSFTRDQGVLKRIRGSPIPGWAYLSSTPSWSPSCWWSSSPRSEPSSMTPRCRAGPSRRSW